MFTMRCTQRLLRRGLAVSPIPYEPPATLLGDWYANIIYIRPYQFILCASANTLLPVIVPAKDARHAPGRLIEALRDVLNALGVPTPGIDGELGQMRECRIDRTADRRVLSSLNELAFLLVHQMHHHEKFSLAEHALWLADTPMKLIGYESPVRATRNLFGAAGESKRHAQFAG